MPGFCNGLVVSSTPFDVIYPFLSVSLDLDIEKEPDEDCLSYLQSFIQPLQYPILGFKNRRAMLGSAINLYSASAQNDADLINHVWSVRFGRDHDGLGSSYFGFSSGGDSDGDPYLLKDEEMSCSDRFAAQMLAGRGQSKRCTLADHLLDCPVDNLSVLQNTFASRTEILLPT